MVIDDTKLVCANIYAPNDPRAQHRFYLHLNDILQKFSSESIILGGDYNCPLSKEDKEGGRDFSHKYHVAEEIIKRDNRSSISDPEEVLQEQKSYY